MQMNTQSNPHFNVIPDSESVIVFDGSCNFCSLTVRFILRNDSSKLFLFAPAQSPVGAQLMKTHGISSLEPDTFLLIHDDRTFVRSDAAIEVSKHLGIWKMFAVLQILPRTWRDFGYECIASHRYKWFGKRDTCFIPTARYRSRFIGE